MIIKEELLDVIKNDMKENHPGIYHESFSNDESRDVFKRILKGRHGKLLDTEDKLESVMRELVGLGIIEELITNPNVTDIGFDGKKLIVEGNGIEKYTIEDIDEDYIEKIIAKFSNATGKDLTTKNPILNTSMKHLRLNAVHKQNAVDGTTAALRISRPGLALNEDNWINFAPIEVLYLLEAIVGTRSNCFISGSTGTGKTELQKLMISMIPFEERIALIESNKDLYVKENFPNKDIFYWVANETASMEDLIALAGLRSHPIWIMVGEVLGKEVYQMVQGILTDHKFITTLHAVGARAIPKRLLGMAKMGYQVDENMFLDDIYTYSDFGIHTKKSKRNGVRYLSEIVEYHDNHTATTVFKQRETKNGFIHKYGVLSETFFERCEEYMIDYKGFTRS